MNRNLRVRRIALLFVFASSFTGAVAQRDASPSPEITRRYRAEAQPDPAVERALEAEVGQDLASADYLYNYVDLNSDGTDEVLALLTGPQFCGTGGCTLLVLQRAGESYSVLSRTTLVQGPVLVSEQPKAWRDLIVGMGGGGEMPRYAVLAYQGKQGGYPNNPTVAPAKALSKHVAAASYLNTEPEGPRGGNVRGRPWRWTETTNPASGTTRIPDPAAYRLTFSAERLAVATPCLKTAFPYTLSAGALNVNVGAATCTTDPLSSELLKSLTAARRVFFEGDALFVDLFADGGTLQFRR